MKSIDYPSSLTKAELEQIKPCLNVKRHSKWRLLNIINSIFYICDGGNKWRNLPQDFTVPWQRVYLYFRKWVQEGVWQAMYDQVVMLRRMQKGGAPAPSFAEVDTQTVHDTAMATEEVGYDGGRS